LPNVRSGTRIRLMAWLLFEFNGRVSRNVYWLAYLMILFVQAILVRPLVLSAEASLNGDVAATPIWPLLALLATLYCHIAVSVKRLHDAGLGGFLATAVLVPLLQLIFTIWAGILPGTDGPNRYGAEPDRLPT
jgi:uncharacterized membrane protein YhaH (DUF805 family)